MCEVNLVETTVTANIGTWTRLRWNRRDLFAHDWVGYGWAGSLEADGGGTQGKPRVLPPPARVHQTSREQACPGPGCASIILWKSANNLNMHKGHFQNSSNLLWVSKLFTQFITEFMCTLGLNLILQIFSGNLEGENQDLQCECVFESCVDALDAFCKSSICS